MKAALATVLVASVLASAVPARAQESAGQPTTEQRALRRGERVGSFRLIPRGATTPTAVSLNQPRRGK